MPLGEVRPQTAYHGRLTNNEIAAMSARNVAVIVGSLRKESFNRKLANAVIAIAPGHARDDHRADRRPAVYNQDLETSRRRFSGPLSAMRSVASMRCCS
jgi:hypothetical protein